MATTVAALQAVLTANTLDFDKAMAGAEAKAVSAKKVIGLAAVGIAAGVGYMAAKSVSAAADFEQGLNKMQAVSGATNDQMKEIQKTAIALGRDITLPGTSAKDAAEAMTELSKSGFTVKQTMASVKATLLLSAAANISNADAAEIASNAVNAFGIKASRTSKVVDMLANASNASSIEIKDAADSMKMAAAVFSGFQGPTLGAEGAMRELATATALLGNAGIKGSDAGTSLKQTLLQLTGPTQQAKGLMWALKASVDGAAISQQQMDDLLHGSKKIRDAAVDSIEKMNKDVKVSGDIAYTASGKMRPLHEIVGLVTKATAGMTDEMKANTITTIFGADASRSIIALMNAQAEGWDKMAAKIDRHGSAQELANARMKGFRGTMDALNSTVETLQIEMGLVLLPTITKMLQEFTKGIGILSEHKTTMMVVIGALGALATAYLLVIGLQKAWTVATTLWTAATGAATAAQWLLNVALTANPIGIVIVALVALAAAIVVAWQRSETFRAVVTGAWEAIRTTVRDVIGFFTNTAWPAIHGFITNIQGAFDAVRDWLRDNWKTALIVLFTGLPGALWVAFRSEWGEAFVEKLKDAFRGIRDWIKVHIVDVIVDYFEGLPDRLLAPLRDLARQARDIIGKVNPFGDPANPNMTLPSFGAVAAITGGDSTINQGLWDELARARSMGLALTSGYRPGAITANGTPSDHGVFPSKAIDVAGAPSSMAMFFRSMIGDRSIKQAFYDPLGSIFGGVLSSYREGGHSDHVHAAVYDKGGWLPPGLSLAYNGLGRPERVGGTGDVHVHLPGAVVVGNEDAVARKLADLFTMYVRRGGTIPGFSTP